MLKKKPVISNTAASFVSIVLYPIHKLTIYIYFLETPCFVCDMIVGYVNMQI